MAISALPDKMHTLDGDSSASKPSEDIQSGATMSRLKHVSHCLVWAPVASLIATLQGGIDGRLRGTLPSALQRVACAGQKLPAGMSLASQ